jgi:hypothetical protein
VPRSEEQTAPMPEADKVCEGSAGEGSGRLLLMLPVHLALVDDQSNEVLGVQRDLPAT